MKTSTVFLASLLTCLQGAVINNPEDELRKTTACLEQSKVSIESMRNLQLGIFVEDPRLKEYLLCVSKNAGFQNEAGYLQTDTIRMRLKGGHYSDDTINEVVKQCTYHKETPEETAFQFMRCVHQNAFPKNYK